MIQWYVNDAISYTAEFAGFGIITIQPYDSLNDLEQ